MRVADMNVMKNPAGFLALDENETLDDVIRRMAEIDGHAVAVTSNGRLSGIFTEHDLMKRVVAFDMKPKDLHLRDVMTADVITARLDEDAFDVMYRMDEKPHRYIPVVDNDGQIAGMLSTRDFSAYTVPESVDRAIESSRAVVTSRYQPFLIGLAIVLYTIFLISAF
jgi:signal-transduction protein with cAMP-binding, CBS, and nucleotidyltransferase domain